MEILLQLVFLCIFNSIISSTSIFSFSYLFSLSVLGCPFRHLVFKYIGVTTVTMPVIPSLLT